MATKAVRRGERKRVRITVDLPQSLWNKISSTLHRSAAKSRNSLIVQAIEEHLERLEQAWIDEQFSRMEQDERYRALNLQIVKEFEKSDWEALRIGEGKT